MRRVISSSLLAIALLVVAPVPSDAWRNGGGGQGTTWRGGGQGTWRGGGHGRAFIGVGPAFWWGAAYPWYYSPYYAYAPYAYAPYAYAPPPEEPPVYPQAAPAPDSPPQAYWYYCPSARSYYPTAPTCPEVWVKVPPRPE